MNSMSHSSSLNAQDNPPITRTSNLFDSIRTALVSISEQCIELDIATEALELSTFLRATDEQAQLYPFFESLRVQAVELIESKALLTEASHKALLAYRAYIETLNDSKNGNSHSENLIKVTQGGKVLGDEEVEI